MNTRSHLVSFSSSSIGLSGVILVNFYLTYLSSPTLFTTRDFTYITVMSAVIGIVAAAIIFSAKLLPKLKAQTTGLATFLIVFSVYSINWSVSVSFVDKHLMLALLGCITFVLIYMLITAGFFSSIITAALAMIAIATIWWDFKDFTLIREQKTYDVSSINFTSKPNVYFLSFDSIQSTSLVEKYMKIGPVAYHKTLSDNVDVFENFFANRVPSRASLNSVMAMDMEEYDNNKDKLSYFSGIINSRLTEIFRSNGYEINTTFYGEYFGNRKGPYVDRYRIDSNTDGVCEFSTTKHEILSYFGLCWLLDNEILSGGSVSRNVAVYSFLHELSSQPKPQFLMAYIYSPGHTGVFDHNNPVDIENYNNEYIENSKETAEILDTVFNYISTEDPTAILYIFGDHGPWRSRILRIEENPEFFVHDRYGVFGGIYPTGRCRDEVISQNRMPITTAIEGAETVLKCLTGNQYSYLEQRYEINESADGIQREFVDYSYE